MMRRVRDSPYHHPCPRALDLEELDVLLKPRLVLRLQGGPPLPAVLRITFDEFEPYFRIRQRRCPHVNSQHVPEPQILAHALMHHLFMHASPAWIPIARPNRQVLIPKFAPDAQHLDPLRRIGFNKEVVTHRESRNLPLRSSIYMVQNGRSISIRMLPYVRPTHAPPASTSAHRHRHRGHLYRLCMA